MVRGYSDDEFPHIAYELEVLSRLEEAGWPVPAAVEEPIQGESLAGVIDFEATHLNYRVADFANSWRGYQDEVIEGYEEVNRLSDLDWELLVPAYWAWLFIGVKQEIETSLAGECSPPDFEWQIRHLLRREGLTGRLADPYPI